MVCLDSDVLINYLRKDKNTIDLFDRLKKENRSLCTTSINSFELLKGIPKLSRMDITKVLEFLKNFEIYDFDFESSKKAAEIFENLKSNGNLIELPDIMIASIAIVNGEKLLTSNTAHFKRINGLNIDSY